MKVHDIPAGWRLNYWVARALGYEFREYARDPSGVCYHVTCKREGHPSIIPLIGNCKLFERGERALDGSFVPRWSEEMPDYSHDPRAFWPLINAARISIDQDNYFSEACEHPGQVFACLPETACCQYDVNPAVAAMRCIVENAFGKEVGKEFE